MTTNYSIDRDLKEAEAMAKSLVPYVHQEPLYGSVGGLGFFAPTSMPSLTLGAFLMRTRRLTEFDAKGDLDARQIARLQKVLHRNEQVYDEYRKHYETKLLRESKSRLKAMQTFFEECHASPKACSANYMPEATRRTIVQEVLVAMDEIELAQDDALKQLIVGMDSRLRQFANVKYGFVFDPVLEPFYPEGVYWWLYQEPHNPTKDA